MRSLRRPSSRSGWGSLAESGELGTTACEADPLVPRDRRHAGVEPVLEALVGQCLDEPDLAAHVMALDPQRGPHDQDVDALGTRVLGGFPVYPAVDMNLATDRLVLEQVACRQELLA